MPIRAILFDKDGTLVDFERTWGPAVETVLHHLANGDDDLYRKLCAASGLVAGVHFLPDSPLVGEPTSVFAAPWAALLKQPADAAFFARVDRLLCRETTAHLSPIGEPRRVLAELAARGYRLGLMTNDAEASARAHIGALGLDRLIVFVAGYDSGFGCKPAPGPVLAFAAAVKVPAAEVAVVGDTAIDVATAQAADARAVLVRTGPDASDAFRTAKADAVLDSIADLPQWLEHHGR